MRILWHLFGWSILLSAAAGWGCKEEIPPLPPASAPSEELLVPLPPTTAPAVTAPHGGRLQAIPDDLGYVEWLVKGNRFIAYFLDIQGKPLKGIQDTVLYISTPNGPRIIKLQDGQDAAYEDTGGSGLVEDAASLTGLIRFKYNGEGYRVLLPLPKPVPQTLNSDLR